MSMKDLTLSVPVREDLAKPYREQLLAGGFIFEEKDEEDGLRFIFDLRTPTEAYNAGVIYAELLIKSGNHVLNSEPR